MARALLETSSRAGAPEPLFDLVVDRNLLGLDFSKTKLLKATREFLKQRGLLDSRLRQVYETCVVQVADEFGAPSSNISRLLLRDLVSRGKLDLARELAQGMQNLGGTLDAVGLVERFGSEAAAAAMEEEEEEGSGEPGTAEEGSAPQAEVEEKDA